MTLALFDLDNTLLSGDSDYEWGQFLVSKGLVDPVAYEAENQRFYGQYRAGTLDILEYSAFSFGPLSERSMEELATLHREFMAEVIEPILPEKSQELVAHHRAQGHGVWADRIGRPAHRAGGGRWPRPVTRSVA